MIVYRICELKNNQLLTLFHSIKGTRVMPLNTWLTAEIKEVTDGTRERSTIYNSGFHVLFSLEETEKFLKAKFKAKRTLVIVECEIGDNYWSKEHSRHAVYLAEKIKILKVISKIVI